MSNIVISWQMRRVNQQVEYCERMIRWYDKKIREANIEIEVCANMQNDRREECKTALARWHALDQRQQEDKEYDKH